MDKYRIERLREVRRAIDKGIIPVASENASATNITKPHYSKNPNILPTHNINNEPEASKASLFVKVLLFLFVFIIFCVIVEVLTSLVINNSSSCDNNSSYTNQIEPIEYEGITIPKAIKGVTSTDNNENLSVETIEESGLKDTAKNLITFKVINKDVLLPHKISFDIQVDRVDSKLPTKKQLADIATYLRNSEKPHKRTFINFYFPDMLVGEGAWATANFNPNLEVWISYTNKIDTDKDKKLFSDNTFFLRCQLKIPYSGYP